MGMILPLSLANDTLKKDLLVLQPGHSATLHVAELTSFHLHTKKMIGVMASYFYNTTHARLANPRADVAIAIVCHLNNIIKTKSLDAINFNSYRRPCIINQQKIPVASFFIVASFFCKKPPSWGWLYYKLLIFIIAHFT